MRLKGFIAGLFVGASVAGAASTAQNMMTGQPMQGGQSGSMMQNMMGGTQSGQSARMQEMMRKSGMSGPNMKSCMSMMEQGLGPADKNYDKRFIDMMIPHHQGAIDMAEDALKKAQHPELRQLAQNIITAQQQEIRQMQSWRQQWYGK